MNLEEVLFVDGDVAGFRLHAGNIGLVQAFLEANPAYTQMVAGRPPLPDEARQELTDFPKSLRPEDVYVLGLRLSGEMVGFAGLLRSWPVAGVSYISLFQIAEILHGSGAAQSIYGALERWMISAFSPQWLRLGVVGANARGRRFWERAGYHEIEQKHDFVIGTLTHTVAILIKSVCGGDDAAYWKFVSAGSLPPR
jgi:hypothetical protein